MTKELRKAIMDRSWLQNKYLKYPSKENFVNMKKIENKCNPICRKSKTKYLKRSTEKRISSCKQFWNFVKPLLTNKDCMSNDFISISTCETRINVFNFTSKALFFLLEIIKYFKNFQIFKCHDVIKCLSMKHETHFIE